MDGAYFEFHDRRGEHSPECSMNHGSISGSMEARGTVELFQRQLNERGLIQDRLMGDGDSKSYKISWTPILMAMVLQ